MKNNIYKVAVIGFLGLGINAFAQHEGKVGINSSTPNATLDVVAKDNTGSSIEGFKTPQLTGDALQTMTSKLGADNDGLVVYVTSAVTTADASTTSVTWPGYYRFNYYEKSPSGTTQGIVFYPEKSWVRLEPTGLEVVVEGSNAGRRLVGVNPERYANIGSYAVDLSYQNNETTDGGASGNYSTAIGVGAKAKGANSFAGGQNNTASAKNAVSIVGYNNTASGENSFAGGHTNAASAKNAVSIVGYNNTASGENSFAGGQNNTASVKNAVSIVGYNNTASGENSFAGGQNNTASAKNAVSIVGYNNIASGENSFAGGQSNSAKAQNSFAFGQGNSAEALRSVAFGNRTSVLNGSGDSNNSVVMGVNSTITNSPNSLAYGANAKITNSKNAFVGGASTEITSGDSSVALGNIVKLKGNGSIALGSYSEVNGAGSVALGSQAKVGEYESSTPVDGGIAIGSNATVTGKNGIAIGLNSKAFVEGEIAIGNYATASVLLGKLKDMAGTYLYRGADGEKNTTIVAGGTCPENGKIVYSTDSFYGCANGIWKKLHN